MIRLFATLVAVGSLCTFVVGCGDDPLHPFADIQWKLRCDTMGGCVASLGRDMNNYNGEQGRRIACNVQPRPDGISEFFFTAYQGTEYGLELSNASYRGTGGAVSGACQVRVLESGNTWVGACGANAPSATQPCQIAGFNAASTDPPGVVGRVWCENLPLSGDPTKLRELTSVDDPLPSDRTAERRGAFFNLQNCAGL